MTKKYKNDDCVYCGKNAHNGDHIGDHIFARSFFLEKSGNNLPKVASCKPCNSKKSELETYLTSVLPFGGASYRC